jgi:ABC-2 type transport system ATP-binding protein
MNIIEVKNLKKNFKKVKAVRGISFEVEEGEIFGFLGPNGAGKSTTISIISTLLTQTSGTAKVNGFDVTSQRDEVRESIGLVFQDSSLDEKLTAMENLYFHARLYFLPKKEFQRRVKEVLKLVELYDRRKDIVGNFSGGMKRRLEIARGLIHYPKLLILDEPTIGLDPQTRTKLWEYILKLKKEKNMTIFMTTHYMNEAEYCDRIAVIDKGKIVALDTPGNLKKQIGGDLIIMKSKKLTALQKEIIEKYEINGTVEDNKLRITVEGGRKFLPKLFNELTTEIESIELREPSLDDVFLHFTGRNLRDEENINGNKNNGHFRRRH